MYVYLEETLDLVVADAPGRLVAAAEVRVAHPVAQDAEQVAGGDGRETLITTTNDFDVRFRHFLFTYSMIPVRLNDALLL